jgi:membrane protease subunit HflC
VILGDQRRLIVDSFTMFCIADPLSYYQAVGAGEQGIQIRLNSIVSSAIRRQLGTRELPDGSRPIATGSWPASATR